MMMRFRVDTASDLRCQRWKLYEMGESVMDNTKR